MKKQLIITIIILLGGASMFIYAYNRDAITYLVLSSIPYDEAKSYYDNYIARPDPDLNGLRGIYIPKSQFNELSDLMINNEDGIQIYMGRDTKGDLIGMAMKVYLDRTVATAVKRTNLDRILITTPLKGCPDLCDVRSRLQGN